MFLQKMFLFLELRQAVFVENRARIITLRQMQSMQK